MSCLPVSKQPTAASEQTDKTFSPRRRPTSLVLRVHLQSTKTNDQISVKRKKDSMAQVRSGIKSRTEKTYEKGKSNECVHRLHLHHLSRAGNKNVLEQKTESDAATQAGEENASSSMEKGGWQREGLAVLWREVKERATELRRQAQTEEVPKTPSKS